MDALYDTLTSAQKQVLECRAAFEKKETEHRASHDENRKLVQRHEAIVKELREASRGLVRHILHLQGRVDDLETRLELRNLTAPEPNVSAHFGTRSPVPKTRAPGTEHVVYAKSSAQQYQDGRDITPDDSESPKSPGSSDGEGKSTLNLQSSSSASKSAKMRLEEGLKPAKKDESSRAISTSHAVAAPSPREYHQPDNDHEDSRFGRLHASKLGTQRQQTSAMGRNTASTSEVSSPSSRSAVDDARPWKLW